MAIKKKMEAWARRPLRFAKRRTKEWQRNRALVRGKWLEAKAGVRYELSREAVDQGLVLGLQGFVILGTVPADTEGQPVVLRDGNSGQTVAQAVTYLTSDVPWLRETHRDVRAWELVVPPTIWKTANALPLDLTVKQNGVALQGGAVTLTRGEVQRACELALSEGRSNLSTLHILRHLLALPEWVALPLELLEPLHAFAKKCRCASQLPPHLLPKNSNDFDETPGASRPRPVFDLLDEFNRRLDEFEGREPELFRRLVDQRRLTYRLEAKALSSVLPFFCSIDEVEALLQVTRRPTVWAVCSLRSSWARSYAAAIFGVRGQTRLLINALQHLGTTERFNAVAVGHGMKKFAAGNRSLADKEKVAREYLGFLERLAACPWYQLHDNELIGAAVTALRELYAQGPTSYGKIEARTLRLFGMSPHFWRLLHQDWEHPPARLIEVERRFWSLEQMLGSGTSALDVPALVASAAFFRELGCLAEGELSIALAQQAVLAAASDPDEQQSALRAATDRRPRQQLRFTCLPGNSPHRSPLEKKWIEASVQLPARAHGTTVAPEQTILLVHTTRARLDTWASEARATWLRDCARRGVRYFLCVGTERRGQDGDILTLIDPTDNGLSMPRLLDAAAWAADQPNWEVLLQVPDDAYLSVERLFGEPGLQNVDYAGLPRRRSGARAVGSSPDVLSFVQPCADLRFGVALSRHSVQCLLEQQRIPELRCIASHAPNPSSALGYLLARSDIRLHIDGYHCHQMTSYGSNARGHGYRTFEPSQKSPTQVVAVDDPRALNTLHEGSQEGLGPPRLWPAALTPTVGYNKHQIEFLSPPNRLRRVAQASVIVVAVMYNERLLVEHFLNHYRRIGVEAFAICDNESTDGTREFLREQEDVVLYGTDSSYRDSRYGTIWQQALLDAHCLGRWALVVDADEFFVYPRFEREPIGAYLTHLEQHGYDCSWQALVDMYPYGELQEADFQTNSPWTVCPYFDESPLLQWRLSRGRYSCTSTRLSSFRHRTIPRSEPFAYTSQKHALFRYRPWIRIGMGIHCVSNIQPAPNGTALAHFKYHAGFQSKVAEGVARNEHFNNALEYKNYQTLLAETRGHFGKPDTSEKWTDSETLLARFRNQAQPCPPRSPEEASPQS